MMNNYSFYCIISGRSFHPSSLVIDCEELLIDAMNDPNSPELGVSNERGITSTIFEYGHLRLIPRIPVTDNFDSSFSTFLARLKDVIDKLPSGDWDVVVHVNVGYARQCNFELQPKLVNALNRLRATFALSCYEIE